MPLVINKASACSGGQQVKSSALNALIGTAGISSQDPTELGVLPRDRANLEKGLL